MNNYLTEKVNYKKISKIIILVVCLLMCIAGISIIPDQFKEGTSEGVMNIILIVAFAIPVFIIILSYIDMANARSYAFVFSNNTDTTISFSELRQHLHKSNVEDELQKLIMKGYIKNVIVDLNTQNILLTSENANSAKKIYVTVSCPGCGNSTNLVKGEASMCPYCDRPLMG